MLCFEFVSCARSIIENETVCYCISTDHSCGFDFFTYLFAARVRVFFLQSKISVEFQCKIETKMEPKTQNGENLFDALSSTFEKTQRTTEVLIEEPESYLANQENTNYRLPVHLRCRQPLLKGWRVPAPWLLRLHRRHRRLNRLQDRLKKREQDEQDRLKKQEQDVKAKKEEAKKKRKKDRADAYRKLLEMHHDLELYGWGPRLNKWFVHTKAASVDNIGASGADSSAFALSAEGVVLNDVELRAAVGDRTVTEDYHGTLLSCSMPLVDPEARVDVSNGIFQPTDASGTHDVDNMKDLTARADGGEEHGRSGTSLDPMAYTWICTVLGCISFQILKFTHDTTAYAWIHNARAFVLFYRVLDCLSAWLFHCYFLWLFLILSIHGLLLKKFKLKMSVTWKAIVMLCHQFSGMVYSAGLALSRIDEGELLGAFGAKYGPALPIGKAAHRIFAIDDRGMAFHDHVIRECDMLASILILISSFVLTKSSDSSKGLSKIYPLQDSSAHSFTDDTQLSAHLQIGFRMKVDIKFRVKANQAAISEIAECVSIFVKNLVHGCRVDGRLIGDRIELLIIGVSARSVQRVNLKGLSKSFHTALKPVRQSRDARVQQCHFRSVVREINELPIFDARLQIEGKPHTGFQSCFKQAPWLIGQAGAASSRVVFNLAASVVCGIEATKVFRADREVWLSEETFVGAEILDHIGASGPDGSVCALISGGLVSSEDGAAVRDSKVTASIYESGRSHAVCAVGLCPVILGKDEGLEGEVGFHQVGTCLGGSEGRIAVEAGGGVPRAAVSNSLSDLASAGGVSPSLASTEFCKPLDVVVVSGRSGAGSISIGSGKEVENVVVEVEDRPIRESSVLDNVQVEARPRPVWIKVILRFMTRQVFSVLNDQMTGTDLLFHICNIMAITMTQDVLMHLAHRAIPMDKTMEELGLCSYSVIHVLDRVRAGGRKERDIDRHCQSHLQENNKPLYVFLKSIQEKNRYSMYRLFFLERYPQGLNIMGQEEFQNFSEWFMEKKSRFDSQSVATSGTSGFIPFISVTEACTYVPFPTVADECIQALKHGQNQFGASSQEGSTLDKNINNETTVLVKIEGNCHDDASALGKVQEGSGQTFLCAKAGILKRMSVSSPEHASKKACAEIHESPHDSAICFKLVNKDLKRVQETFWKAASLPWATLSSQRFIIRKFAADKKLTFLNEAHASDFKAWSCARYQQYCSIHDCDKSKSSKDAFTTWLLESNSVDSTSSSQCISPLNEGQTGMAHNAPSLNASNRGMNSAANTEGEASGSEGAVGDGTQVQTNKRVHISDGTTPVKTKTTRIQPMDDLHIERSLPGNKGNQVSKVSFDHGIMPNVSKSLSENSNTKAYVDVVANRCSSLEAAGSSSSSMPLNEQTGVSHQWPSSQAQDDSGQNRNHFVETGRLGLGTMGRLDTMDSRNDEPSSFNVSVRCGPAEVSSVQIVSETKQTDKTKGQTTDSAETRTEIETNQEGAREPEVHASPMAGVISSAIGSSLLGSDAVHISTTGQTLQSQNPDIVSGFVDSKIDVEQSRNPLNVNRSLGLKDTCAKSSGSHELSLFNKHTETMPTSSHAPVHDFSETNVAAVQVSSHLEHFNAKRPDDAEAQEQRIDSIKSGTAAGPNELALSVSSKACLMSSSIGPSNGLTVVDDTDGNQCALESGPGIDITYDRVTAEKCFTFSAPEPTRFRGNVLLKSGPGIDVMNNHVKAEKCFTFSAPEPTDFRGIVHVDLSDLPSESSRVLPNFTFNDFLKGTVPEGTGEGEGMYQNQNFLMEVEVKQVSEGGLFPGSDAVHISPTEKMVQSPNSRPPSGFVDSGIEVDQRRNLLKVKRSLHLNDIGAKGSGSHTETMTTSNHALSVQEFSETNVAAVQEHSNANRPDDAKAQEQRIDSSKSGTAACPNALALDVSSNACLMSSGMGPSIGSEVLQVVGDPEGNHYGEGMDHYRDSYGQVDEMKCQSEVTADHGTNVVAQTRTANQMAGAGAEITASSDADTKPYPRNRFQPFLNLTDEQKQKILKVPKKDEKSDSEPVFSPVQCDENPREIVNMAPEKTTFNSGLETVTGAREGKESISENVQSRFGDDEQDHIVEEKGIESLDNASDSYDEPDGIDFVQLSLQADAEPLNFSPRAGNRHERKQWSEAPSFGVQAEWYGQISGNVSIICKNANFSLFLKRRILATTGDLSCGFYTLQNDVSQCISNASFRNRLQEQDNAMLLNGMLAVASLPLEKYAFSFRRHLNKYMFLEMQQQLDVFDGFWDVSPLPSAIRKGQAFADSNGILFATDIDSERSIAAQWAVALLSEDTQLCEGFLRVFAMYLGNAIWFVILRHPSQKSWLHDPKIDTMTNLGTDARIAAAEPIVIWPLYSSTNSKDRRNLRGHFDALTIGQGGPSVMFLSDAAGSGA